eukprot:COSAG01_NODE_291_length_19378_cov_38.136418_8_plen_220_part_00
MAVGLKNGGLREITTDIIYPVSRMERGSFQSGVQQEFRWRSDSSRYWLPRESRLFAEIKFKFGETALTGSGEGHNKFMAIGKHAPRETTKGAPPNPNVALTAAPLHALFDQARMVMNGTTIENNPNLYDTACAQLLTKVDTAGPDTSGSGMCNSLRKDHGRQVPVHERLLVDATARAVKPLPLFTAHHTTQHIAHHTAHHVSLEHGGRERGGSGGARGS